MKLSYASSYNIDDVDRKIIRLLQKDSRKSFNKLSEGVEIAVGTAYNRVKNMEDKGIIKGYSVLLDSDKLGYDLTALILVKADGQYLTEVENKLAKLDEVISIYDITGEYDIAVISRFKDRTQLNKFIKSILRMPHVINTTTNVVLNVVKEDFRVKV